MARRSGTGGAEGCGCVIVALLGVTFLASVAAWGIEMLAVVMAAPAIVPYLLLNQPEQFHHDQTLWLAALIAAPLVAFGLATTQLPRRARKWLKINTDLDYSNQKDRRARRTRSYVETVLLLTVTTAVGGIMLVTGGTPHTFGQLLNRVGIVLVPCLLLPVAFRVWDHWSPPLGEPVTVEMVRQAERDADRKLKQVRQQNDAVRQMTRQVEECLAAARHEISFVAMSGQHFTSFKCANVAHGSYESTKDTHHFLAGMAARAKATAAPRLVPLRDPRTGQRMKPPQVELRASAAALSGRSKTMAAETARGLQFVHTLNLRTGDLRDTIRDTCGQRGQRWYDDLIERRAYARANEA